MSRTIFLSALMTNFVIKLESDFKLFTAFFDSCNQDAKEGILYSA